MKLQLITPEKTLFSGDVDMVTVPGAEGVFAALDGHAPFISALKPGIVHIERDGKSQPVAVVLDGIAEIMPEGAQILAEVAQDCSRMSVIDGQAQLEAARKAAEDAISDAEKQRTQQALRLAETLAEGLKA